MGNSGSSTTTAPGTRPWDASSGVGGGAAAAQSLMLMGKVQLEGGGAPEEPVRIERVCSGVPYAEGFTDTKGNFSISLGQGPGAMPDASEAESRAVLNPSAPPRALSQAQLATCDLRAALRGYRSDVISLANRRSLDNPNIGTIFLHRLSNVGGLTISATTALAPKDARKAYEKALEDERKTKPEQAQKELEKAVEIYPRFAAAWFELGTMFEQRGAVDQARAAYDQSIAADSKYLQPYERECAIAYRAGKWQETADVSDRLLRLDPFDYPEAYNYNAAANVKLNRLDQAERSAREAVKLDTAHRDAGANYTLGYILAQKGNFSDAAQYLHAALEIDSQGPQAESVRKLLNEVERAQAQQH